MAVDPALLARLNVKPEELRVVRAQTSFLQSLYILEVVRGLAVTLRHLLRNLVRQSAMPTSQFPEVQRVLPEGFRGRHRLTVKDDGTPRCVACMMCPTACPADCIHIEAAESPDPSVEKVPVRFEIDLMRCIFCGFCVEACPKDAIRMDTGRFFDLAGTHREDFVLTMDRLLND
ncbi:MAG TPA: NADH-quinone oxidoreductase subunit I [Candidatus Krumholzibacteria bacterium]|jgi:NADH-quinone oxidoreductase subunit I|nr:NADH-quinone oxidoreductase subunit I [Candidatus Krumholzibacteria bacterium]